ncbi:ABC transporter ATP-binding protein [Nocardia sp. CC227C]|uniref:ABC transporter ATP-binding protein n=1 Tax=Nocardia sp. CC227C TaxID=3044562 RepID=UPI00278C8B2D|nr:ABC transporter ATP-binding protein [Nocardia sp. CC227C]
MIRLLVQTMSEGGADSASAVSLKSLRATLITTVLTAVAQGIAFALLVPVLRALLGPDPADAWPWLAAFAVAAAGYGVLFLRAARSGYDLGGSVLRTVHHRLGDHIATLPLGWFEARRIGELGSLASEDVLQVANATANLVRPIVAAVVTPATVVLLMFVFDWRIALAVVAMTPLILLAFRLAGRLVERAENGAHAATAAAGTRVVEYAQSQRVLRACGQTVRGFSALDDALTAQRDAGRRLITAAVPGLVTFTFVVQAVFTVVLWYGTYLAVGGTLDTPTLLAMLVLAVRFVEPMIAAAELGGALKVARNHLLRLREVLDTPPLPEPATSVRPQRTDVDFDGVTFGYGGPGANPPVLDDVSFTIPAGKLTALAGPSGAGKTTVTRLIARFFDTDAGTVRIGGHDVRDIPTETLMSMLSLVFQDVYLFDGTIADNIRLARPDATDDEVRRAAAVARVDEIVDRLPQGWDTRVGEGGAILSGGERQRVSIARAVLKDAPIVLADEPTSALDPENEVAIRDGLLALARNRTVLVIAHRPATLASADQVLFLYGGTVTESGTHRELLAAGGRYARFWRDRDRAQGWRLAPALTTPSDTGAALVEQES